MKKRDLNGLLTGLTLYWNKYSSHSLLDGIRKNLHRSSIYIEVQLNSGIMGVIMGRLSAG